MQKTDLSKFNNDWYNSGASWLTRIIWYCTNACFFNSYFPFYSTKIFLLRLFGAKVGRNVVIKPKVNIKYPWKLKIGNYCWIGEGVWIDNLDEVIIGDNSCISQGALLLCGNHNYKKSSFDLMTGKIILEEGVWLGAKSIVCGGVICKSHSVLSVASVAVSDLEAYSVYQGNPAVKIKERIISE
jgi:putative colanic acid biosynthesis acetyltransferase WcaF